MASNVTALKTTETSDEEKIAVRWHARITAEKAAHDDWRKEAEEAWKVYRPEHDDKSKYPLLWSVTQIQHSAVYSSRPVPVSKPRADLQNPVVKDAAALLGAALEYAIDETNFDECMDRVVDDYLVAGAGIPRGKLDAEINTVPVIDPMTGQQLLDAKGKPQTREAIGEQQVRAEFVPWSRFGWEPAECWDHVGWIYFRHPMKKKEIIARWGEDASFGASGSEFTSDGAHRGGDAPFWIYEIWDRDHAKVITLAEGGEYPLEVVDDPLKLVGFWPVPQPVFTNLAFDTLTPKPDYCMIKCLDDELQEMYTRAASLIRQIKALTFHDASITELQNFEDLTDGTSIAIANVLERFSAGGPGGADLRRLILPWPVEEKITALQNVNSEIVAKRAQIDELLGIPDVVRGASNPQDGQETQKIKERWSGLRLRRKQIAVQRQIRGLFRIMAELTVTHVTRDNLQKMTQKPISDEVWALLQNDGLRCLAIDLETDSTVAKDEFEDKKSRNELLTAVNTWAQTTAPAANANVIPWDLARETLRIAVQPYTNQARGLDQVIDSMQTTQGQLAQLQQMQGQLAQQGQQIEQMTFALQQYSQAEEARKNAELANKTKETDAKVGKTNADTQEVLSGLNEAQIQAAETQADIGETVAKTEQIYHDMAQPPKADCGCDDQPAPGGMA